MSEQEKNTADPFEVAKLFKYLRVADVADGMDGIGYFNIGLVDREIRPLWLGMRFWGVAFTIRCVPSNQPMWKLDTTQDVVDAHGLWFKKKGNISFHKQIKPGHVIAMDSGSSGEVGYWGSNNGMGMVRVGAAGIITDGFCRDTAEVTQQRTPICCRARGRTIIPGRIETVEVQTPIGIGGVQIRPGDIVGCDDDGIIAVPIEVASQVAIHARAVLLADMRSRKKLYTDLSMPDDATVDFEVVEAYYRQFE